MGSLETLPYLRACVDTDDTFLYDVFCTTWEKEVEKLPNPKLAQHVLRIQHIAQERRFRSRYPGHERFVVLEQGEDAGRLYVDRNESRMHVVDLTLLPRFQSQGIGTRVFMDLFDTAREDGQVVTVQVPRSNVEATEFYISLGFRLVSLDDLDNYFEWSPGGIGATKEDPSTVDGGPEAMKEDPSAMKEGQVTAQAHRR